MDADIIVIGAGAAGLAAARALAGASLRTIVLEARERIGGRVLSIPTSRAIVPAELGAEFIHGPAAETRALLREAGMTSITPGGEGWRAGADGGLKPEERGWGSSTGLFDRVRSLAQDESVNDFVRRFENEPALRAEAEEARAFAEGFDAVDPAIASARGIAEEWDSGVDDVSARPIGGYPPMFFQLHQACVARGADIRLSSVVRRIVWSSGSVAVDLIDGSGTAATLRARAAIVTLPAGVLEARGAGAVTFEPDLPARKRTALSFIPMGEVVKVVLEFRSAFWERVAGGRYAEASFFRGAGRPFGAFWVQYPVHAEIVCAWAGGPRAIEMRDASESERIELALDAFGTLIGDPALARAEFVRAWVHDWLRDPFSRGAYTYIAVGGSGARLTLAEPVEGTLFFAARRRRTTARAVR